MRFTRISCWLIRYAAAKSNVDLDVAIFGKLTFWVVRCLILRNMVKSTVYVVKDHLIVLI